MALGNKEGPDPCSMTKVFIWFIPHAQDIANELCQLFIEQFQAAGELLITMALSSNHRPMEAFAASPTTTAIAAVSAVVAFPADNSIQVRVTLGPFIKYP